MQTLLQRTATPNDWGTSPVYNSIKTLIMTQELAPGERIRLESLADQLYVSNTPVREALIQLAAQRMVNDVPNTGFFVKEISESEMLDLCTVNHLMLEWSLRTIRTDIQIPSLLEPPKAFDTSKYNIGNTPHSCVAILDELFTHIARQSGNSEIVHSVQNIGERTHFMRVKESELVSGFNEEVSGLCKVYYQRDITRLLQILNEFHDKRISLMPDIIRLAKQAYQ